MLKQYRWLKMGSSTGFLRRFEMQLSLSC